MTIKEAKELLKKAGLSCSDENELYLLTELTNKIMEDYQRKVLGLSLEELELDND